MTSFLCNLSNDFIFTLASHGEREYEISGVRYFFLKIQLSGWGLVKLSGGGGDYFSRIVPLRWLIHSLPLSLRRLSRSVSFIFRSFYGAIHQVQDQFQNVISGGGGGGGE